MVALDRSPRMHLGCARETGSRTVQLIIHDRRLEIKGAEMDTGMN